MHGLPYILSLGKQRENLFLRVVTNATVWDLAVGLFYTSLKKKKAMLENIRMDAVVSVDE